MPDKAIKAINPWSIFLVTALGVWMATIDVGIVNVALPTLAREFNIHIAHVQWIVSGYLLVICATLPLFGRLGDIYTRRVIYLLGFFIFLISSALCGLAFSFWSLVLFRFLQGFGAAMLMGNNQALVLTSFPKGKQGQALGINSMLAALGLIAGPGLGGLLIGLAGWRLIFFINVPIGILGCILGYYILPKETRNPENHIDFLGAILFALGICCFILAVTHIDDFGILSPKIISLGLVTSIALFLFIKREKYFSQPMVDLNIFKIQPYLSGVIITFIAFIAFAANSILLPFYLQDLIHFKPAIVGLFLLLTPLFMMLLGPISGYLADRYNQTVLATIGLSIVLISLLILASLTIHSPLWHIALAQILLGTGVGTFSAPNNYNMLKEVPKTEISLGASIASLMRNTGRICGIAIAIAIFTIVQKHMLVHSINQDYAFTAGFKYAFLTAAIFLTLAVLLSLKRIPFRVIMAKILHRGYQA
jgi:EmrB/QacA subfamily drug resistance transporter